MSIDSLQTDSTTADDTNRLTAEQRDELRRMADGDGTVAEIADRWLEIDDGKDGEEP